MARKRKQTRDQAIEAWAAGLPADKARHVLASVACALWGDTADQEWGADTLDAIADCLYSEGAPQPD